MKKICLFLLACCCFTLFSCKNEKEVSLDSSDLQNMCRFAVLECYYHNTAKMKKSGFLSNNQLWMDYSAKIKVGIDASKMEIDVKDNVVTIRLPLPEPFGTPNIIEDSFSYFSSEANGKTNIGIDNVLKAKDEANKNMLEELQKNTSIKMTAETRVKKILTNYIDQIGELSGKKFEIKWERLASEK